MVDANQSGCLFVGEGVILKGNFAVPDIASVSGVVEGDLSAKQVAVIACRNLVFIMILSVIVTMSLF
ncbi:MAG: hypothetical protein EBW77_04300 [Burkholderiaceae bacterium]|nr:hypothetical protein [Burkholderiaceae bacterium]